MALSVYQTILTNTQTAEAARLIPAAATAAGLPASSVSQLVTALSLGAEALAEVPGITDSIIATASAALQQSYVVGLRTTALSSLAFGIVGIIGKYRKIIQCLERLVGILTTDSRVIM